MRGNLSHPPTLWYLRSGDAASDGSHPCFCLFSQVLALAHRLGQAHNIFGWGRWCLLTSGCKSYFDQFWPGYKHLVNRLCIEPLRCLECWFFNVFLFPKSLGKVFSKNSSWNRHIPMIYSILKLTQYSDLFVPTRNKVKTQILDLFKGEKEIWHLQTWLH